MNKTKPLQILTAVSFLLLMLVLPLSAQDKQGKQAQPELPDSVFTFRFISGKDMFYAPGLNNGPELTRLFDCVERYKQMIADRKVSLLVDGYFISDGNKAEKYRTAKTRSNRVKSELITRKGLKEVNFITRNQPAGSNFVTIRFRASEDDFLSKLPQVQKDSIPELPTPEPESTVETLEPAEEPEIIIPEEQSEQIVEESIVSLPVEKGDSRFALKTNLLFYAILMPNIEVEWMFTDRWSLALEAQGAWYAKEDPHKVYRLSTVTPEVRFWAIDKSRWHGMYVGIFGGAGLYDLCNGKKDNKGHEGEGWMAGVSAGYMWPISKHLSLDAGIGVGYMRARDKEYLPLDGHFLYQLTKNINYFGPLRLKLSLVWRIPK